MIEFIFNILLTQCSAKEKVSSGRGEKLIYLKLTVVFLGIILSFMNLNENSNFFLLYSYNKNMNLITNNLISRNSLNNKLNKITLYSSLLHILKIISLTFLYSFSFSLFSPFLVNCSIINSKILPVKHGELLNGKIFAISL